MTLLLKSFTLAILISITPLSYAKQKKLMSSDETFRNIINQYEIDYFERFPEQGLVEGRRNVKLDSFSDFSYQGLKAWQLKEDEALGKLKTIDADKLSSPILKVSLELIKEHLKDKQNTRACLVPLWDVNPLDGWHTLVVNLAETQPVGTPELRKKALARFRGLHQVVDDAILNLKLGIEKGFTAPKAPVRRVINQLNTLTTTPVEQSPFYSLAERDGDPQFKKEVARLISDTINMELIRYSQYLELTYLHHARDRVGLWTLPGGDDCYQAMLKANTTTDISPETVHELGHQEMKRITDEIISIGEKRYGIRDVKAIFAKANQETLGMFKSEQDILDYNFALLDKAYARVPDYFKKVPKTEGTIKPYPLHMAKNGAPGEYHQPSEDGSPGFFYINTYEPEKKSSMDMDATLFHELVPGHHFEIALQFENKEVPSLNKYLWNSGFGEGWALYVEGLADEMHLYSDDVAKLGMLSNEALRAARLVVDSGMHSMQWPREQAVAYLKSHTGVDDFVIEGEVDRYIMLPGQATSYMIGKLTIERLRDEAKAALGNKFDIKDFHYHVLKNGNISLSLLEKQIHEYTQSTWKYGF